MQMQKCRVGEKLEKKYKKYHILYFCLRNFWIYILITSLHNFFFSVGNPGAGFSYTGSFATGLLNDSIIRSMADQTNTTQAGVSASDLAYQRQQALSSVLQQAAAAAGRLDLLSVLWLTPVKSQVTCE